MNKELELQLVAKYPKILQNYGGDKMVTCLHWGIETDGGWYDLLDKCMEKMQFICDVTKCQVVADQIKSKFATLRFYYHTEHNEISSVFESTINAIITDIVQGAYKRSCNTCEVTGTSGYACVPRDGNGWYRTLCKEECIKADYVPMDPDLAEYWGATVGSEKDEDKDYERP